jgi:hypothetical protein
LKKLKIVEVSTCWLGSGVSGRAMVYFIVRTGGLEDKIRYGKVMKRLVGAALELFGCAVVGVVYIYQEIRGVLKPRS